MKWLIFRKFNSWVLSISDISISNIFCIFLWFVLVEGVSSLNWVKAGNVLLLPFVHLRLYPKSVDNFLVFNPVSSNLFTQIPQAPAAKLIFYEKRKVLKCFLIYLGNKIFMQKLRTLPQSLGRWVDSQHCIWILEFVTCNWMADQNSF